MINFIERLGMEYNNLKHAHNSGKQRGDEERPNFMRLHGGRALYPYRNLRDLLRPNLNDLVHDVRLIAVEGPRTAYNLGYALNSNPLEKAVYILGVYESLIAHSNRTEL